MNSLKKLWSSAPHRLMSTQPPCCARQPNDVISVLAGPLKRRLAALICIVHPTGCTTGCVHPTGCTAGCVHTTGCTTGCGLGLDSAAVFYTVTQKKWTSLLLRASFWILDRVSELFLNGTSAHNRPFQCHSWQKRVNFILSLMCVKKTHLTETG